MPKLTRRSRVLILIALGVIVLLLAGPRLIDAYVDWLWFGELGYRSVFHHRPGYPHRRVRGRRAAGRRHRVRRAGGGLPHPSGLRPE